MISPPPTYFGVYELLLPLLYFVDMDITRGGGADDLWDIGGAPCEQK